MDESKERKLLKKIDKILKNITDDPEKNNQYLNKELDKIVKKYNIGYFVDVLLSHHLDEKKVMIILKKVIPWAQNLRVEKVRDGKKNPIQVAIQTGYGNDFIMELLDLFNRFKTDWDFDINSLDNKGNTIMHTVIKYCDVNDYDVFNIYYHITNNLFFSMHDIHNAYGTQFPYRIYGSLRHKSISESLRNSLYNALVFYFNIRVKSVLENLKKEDFDLDKFLDLFTFRGELKDNYRNPQYMDGSKYMLKSKKEMLQILLENSDYKDVVSYSKIVLVSEEVDVNSIFETEDKDYLGLIMKSFDDETIYEYFKVIFSHKNFDKKQLINILKSAIYNSGNGNSKGIKNVYKFYEFLVANGLNILDEENILSDFWLYSNFRTNKNILKLYYLFQIADLLKILIPKLENYGLNLTLDDIKKHEDFVTEKNIVANLILSKYISLCEDNPMRLNYCLAVLIARKIYDMYTSNINSTNNVSETDIVGVLQYYKILDDKKFRKTLEEINSGYDELKSDMLKCDVYIKDVDGEKSNNDKSKYLVYKDGNGNTYKKQG